MRIRINVLNSGCKEQLLPCKNRRQSLWQYCIHLTLRILLILPHSILTSKCTCNLPPDYGCHLIPCQMAVSPSHTWTKTSFFAHCRETYQGSSASYCCSSTEQALHWISTSERPLQRKSTSWDMWYALVDWSSLLIAWKKYTTWSQHEQ